MIKLSDPLVIKRFGPLYVISYYSRGVWVVFRPYPNKFVQVMSTQNRRVPGQVIEVVHDDCHEQVQHLQCTQGN